jgi:dehydrogenase/reductase SDR family member 7
MGISLNFIFSALVMAFMAVFMTMDCDPLLYALPAAPTDTNEYTGKVVWVVGASSGIGEQLAIDFARQGATLVLSARRVEKLESVAKLCAEASGAGKTPTIVPLDATDYGSHAAAHESIVQTHGSVDVLVLNAGRSQRGVAVETPVEDSIAMFNTNFFGLVSIATTTVPSMKRGSTVIVMSSVAGKIGVAGGSTYSATKYALQGYFDALRAEVASDGIKVLTVCPGPVVSEIVDHSMRSPGVEISDEPGKMTTERCTGLIMKAVHWGFEEVWISIQPQLAVTYLNTFLPSISRALWTNIVGPSRMRMLKTGGSMYDVAANLGFKKD